MKIETVVIADNYSRNERSISIKIVTTNNELLNDYLNLPRVITKSFPKNTSPEDIKNDIKQEISSLIDAIKDKIKDNGLQGKTIIFNI